MTRSGLVASAALGAIGVISGTAGAADLSDLHAGSLSTITDAERGSDGRAAAQSQTLTDAAAETSAMFGLDPSEFDDVGVVELDVARVAGALGMEVDDDTSFLGRVALHVVDDPSIGATPIVTDFDDPYLRAVERSQVGAVSVYDVGPDGQRILPRQGLRLDYVRPLTSALPGDVEVAFEPRANLTFGSDIQGYGGGAIVRFGRNLTEPRGKASRWYAFIGADAQALTWSLGGNQDRTLRLEDKQLIGDYQVGVARRVAGGDLALGFVHREVKWNDYSRDEQFFGVTYTARR